MTDPASPIPLVDVRALHESIRSELDAAISQVIDGGGFVGGKTVAAFESDFAAYCGTGGCVGVGNGTDALYIALLALDVGPGDEVITASHTFIATAEAIAKTGGRPVLVDVQDDTMVMDPDALSDAVTPRTKAIVPVHLYGQPCDMDAVMAVAGQHGLVVVEDGAQAHGATWGDQKVGSFGHLGCFSFFPGKNLGALGDAGAVVGDDPALLQKVRMLANHGRKEKYLHEMIGTNSRLDSLQAAVLRVKLPHLDAWNVARRHAAQRYLELLAGLDGVRLPACDPKAQHVYHLFAIRVSARDALLAGLKEDGISAGVHYPVPVHAQPAFADLGYADADLPVTAEAAATVLSLPMHPMLSDGDVERVAAAIKVRL